MVTVWESICCINTSEMGSPKDNKLQRNGATVIPLCDASVTYCNCQHRDWMWGAGLLSCWCWSTRPMNHMGKLEKFYNGYPFQTVKEKCGWQKAETQVLYWSLMNFLNFFSRAKELKSFCKRTGSTVDCSTSQVVRSNGRWARKWAPASFGAGLRRLFGVPLNG